ncbi:MAG: MerR family transcriptional regulator, partial [Novosphingobium sp.]
RPLKRSGGRRYYRPEDITLVERIDRLVHHEGYTLKGAMKALQEPERVSAATDAQQVAASPPLSAMSANFAMRARLISLRATLVNALHEA